MATLIDKGPLQITGADLTGSSGGTSRTYTLPSDTVSTTGLLIVVSNVTLNSSDYSQSNNVITFVNAIFDQQEISIWYKEQTSTASTSFGYATNLELNEFVGMAQYIPNAKNTARKNLGTGDNSTTRYWLGELGVISGTVTLSYGASEASVTALTESTHYTINYEDGLVTLTAAGVTALSTNILYAAFAYNIEGITDGQITDILSRAEREVDNLTNNHFVDGTVATPSWNQEQDEVHDGKGVFDRNYFTKKYPIPDVSTTLDGSVSADDTTITVTSTAGFPSSGYLLVGNDKIQYTGKTTTTFTGCTSVSAHSSGATVSAYVVEISTTNPGGSISWDVLTEGTEFEIDRNTGRVHIYADGGYEHGAYYDVLSSPPRNVASRVRFSYLQGTSTIPSDITHLTLLLASKDILARAVRKAHGGGLNSFNPSLVQVDDAMIEQLVANHRNELNSIV